MDLRVASTCQNEGPVHWLSQGLLIPLPTLQVWTADHVCEGQGHGPSLSPQRRRTWLQHKAAGPRADTLQGPFPGIAHLDFTRETGNLEYVTSPRVNVGK